MTKFERLEASRIARGQADPTEASPTQQDERRATNPSFYRRSDFGVIGPSGVIADGLERETAERMAGRLGLKFEAGHKRKAKVGFDGPHRTVPYASLHGGGFGYMTPERRREISRKANAARWGK